MCTLVTTHTIVKMWTTLTDRIQFANAAMQRGNWRVRRTEPNTDLEVFVAPENTWGLDRVRRMVTRRTATRYVVNDPDMLSYRQWDLLYASAFPMHALSVKYMYWMHGIPHAELPVYYGFGLVVCVLYASHPDGVCVVVTDDITGRMEPVYVGEGEMVLITRNLPMRVTVGATEGEGCIVRCGIVQHKYNWLLDRVYAYRPRRPQLPENHPRQRNGYDTSDDSGVDE